MNSYNEGEFCEVLILSTIRLHMELKERHSIEAKNKDLNDKLMDARQGLLETGTALFKVQQATEQLMSKREQKDIQLQRAMEAHKQYEIKIADLETKLSLADDGVKLSSTVSSYRKIISEKEELLMGIEKENAEVKSALSKTRKELAIMEQDKVEQEHLLRGYQKKLLGQESAVKELEAKNTQLEAELQQLRLKTEGSLSSSAAPNPTTTPSPEAALADESSKRKEASANVREAEDSVLVDPHASRTKDMVAIEMKLSSFESEKKTLEERILAMEQQLKQQQAPSPTRDVSSLNQDEEESRGPGGLRATYKRNPQQSVDLTFSPQSSIAWSVGGYPEGSMGGPASAAEPYLPYASQATHLQHQRMPQYPPSFMSMSSAPRQGGPLHMQYSPAYAPAGTVPTHYPGFTYPNEHSRDYRDPRYERFQEELDWRQGPERISPRGEEDYRRYGVAVGGGGEEGDGNSVDSRSQQGPARRVDESRSRRRPRRADRAKAVEHAEEKEKEEEEEEVQEPSNYFLSGRDSSAVAPAQVSAEVRIAHQVGRAEARKKKQALKQLLKQRDQAEELSTEPMRAAEELDASDDLVEGPARDSSLPVTHQGQGKALDLRPSTEAALVHNAAVAAIAEDVRRVVTAGKKEKAKGTVSSPAAGLREDAEVAPSTPSSSVALQESGGSPRSKSRNVRKAQSPMPRASDDRQDSSEVRTEKAMDPKTTAPPAATAGDAGNAVSIITAIPAAGGGGSTGSSSQQEKDINGVSTQFERTRALVPTEQAGKSAEEGRQEPVPKRAPPPSIDSAAKEPLPTATPPPQSSAGSGETLDGKASLGRRRGGRALLLAAVVCSLRRLRVRPR